MADAWRFHDLDDGIDIACFTDLRVNHATTGGGSGSRLVLVGTLTPSISLLVGSQMSRTWLL
ncbi:MAG: hypothetical protein ACRBM6_02025 [Geminicoccales bacterium]